MTGGQGEEALEFGPFRLLPLSRTLMQGQQRVPLGNRALNLLIVLAQSAGETLDKHELMARAWPDAEVDESSLRVHLTALRRRLGNDGHRYVVNVPGRGYAFLAPLRRAASSAPPALVNPGPAPSWTAPLTMPEMIGRERLADEVEQRLQRSRLVSLVGAGGIGKTSLALAVAVRRAARSPDGVRFVDLAPVGDAAQIPAALAAALGIGQYDSDLMPGVLAQLAGQHLLIILDNCEQLVEAVALLAERVLRAAPGIELLVTSREPLRCEGEWIQRLRPLALPDRHVALTASRALEYSAIRLFVERACASFDAFVFDDAAAVTVAEICRRLDGIPLAIELAAARVDMLGLDGLLSGLDDRFGLLSRGRRTALPRQRTLAATLEWSYLQLSAEEQAFFCRLAVFVGAFSSQAAADVALTDSTEEAQRLLGSLTLKSIATVDLAGDAPCYRLPESMRHYGADRLRERGDDEATRRRLATLCLRRLLQAEQDAGVMTGKHWLARYAPHIDDLRESLRWTLSTPGEQGMGVALAARAMPLWSQCAPLPELRTTAEAALSALRVAPDPSLEQALHSAIGTCSFHSDVTPAEAVPSFIRALALADQIGDAAAALRCLSGLCASHIHLGEYSQALASAREHHKRVVDDTAQLAAHRLLAVSLHFAGEQTATQEHLAHLFAKGVPVAAGSSGVLYHQQVTVLTISAMNLWLRGLPDTAMREAESALALAQELASPIAICQTLANAACPIALRNGDLTRARQLVALLDGQASRHSLAAWRGWAAVYAHFLDHGQVADAALPGPQLEITATLVRGTAGHDASARASRGHAGWCRAELMRQQGESLLPRQPKEAHAMWGAAMELARNQGANAWALRIGISLAQAALGRGHASAARLVLEPLLETWTEGLCTPDHMDAARLLERCGSFIG